MQQGVPVKADKQYTRGGEGSIQPKIKVSLVRQKAFFGPGTRQFLALVATTGSVRGASEQMGLSYSKAWKMLDIMENELCCRIVERSKGGKNGGRANLTPRGLQLLRCFEAYEKEVSELAQNLYHKHFSALEQQFETCVKHARRAANE